MPREKKNPESILYTIHDVNGNTVFTIPNPQPVTVTFYMHKNWKPLLTKMEIEILKLILEQCTSKEIADKLCISIKAIGYHRSNLLRKTESKNIIGVALWAVEHGYCKIES